MKLKDKSIKMIFFWKQDESKHLYQLTSDRNRYNKTYELVTVEKRRNARRQEIRQY